MRADPAAAAPTLAQLRELLPPYGQYRFDLTLAETRRDIGPVADPANPEHARRLRRWLNEWGCRIGYPMDERHDVFVSSMRGWWVSSAGLMPAPSRPLRLLSNAEIAALGQAFGDLAERPAHVSEAGRTRTFQSTATAKVLYFVRPDAVTAWDKKISELTGGDFTTHLLICRGWAETLVREAADAGVAEHEIGTHLGRPESSVAKLLDEWLYATVSGGFGAA